MFGLSVEVCNFMGSLKTFAISNVSLKLTISPFLIVLHFLDEYNIG